MCAPKTLRSAFPQRGGRLSLLRRRNRHRTLDYRGDALDVRDELRVQAEVEAQEFKNFSCVGSYKEL